MSYAPGWYDAGTPGKLRWWDGVQWSAHETDVSSAPGQGWYPTPGGRLRWWDGRTWTGLRVKDGVPGTDWATAEQPAVAWAFGSVFAALALAQFAIGAVIGSVSPAGISMVLLAVLWFAIGATSSAVRRIPSPVVAPEAPDVVRPLPGEVEGPGAGWFPVATRTSRWWTGLRWSQYTASRFGVRPTFHGARSLRLLLGMGWVLIGAGFLGALVGILMLVIGSGASWELSFIGWFVVVGGVLIAGLGGIVFAMSATQRRLLVPPAGPPQPGTQLLG
ncbi:DUF2510 domain-containing protein [Herbiconiux sp. P18]|uniref:DUF2510 domain-containing protein n=1 Tax=Herbiconiux liangxiaofengii TaxID=3342795 RepID=UPI0035BB5F60